MLTKDLIKANLKKDPYWELPDDASNQEWQWYDEVYEELEEAGELTFSGGSEDDDDYGATDDWDVE